jgi:hypothetical protein
MIKGWHLPIATCLCLAGCSGQDSAPVVAARETERAVEEATPAAGPDGMPVPPLIDLKRRASPARSSGRTTCHGIKGFLFGRDAVGRIVRDTPDVNGRELGRIPPPVYSDVFGGDWPYEFNIIGSQDGWLQISHVAFDEQMGGNLRSRLFKGTGWIAAGGVRVGVQSRTGFAEPSHSAAVLFSGYPDSFLDATGPQRVVACRDNWILATWPASDPSQKESPPWRLNFRPEAIVSRNPLILQAWVTGVCNVIETTCDGVNGDYPERGR